MKRTIFSTRSCRQGIALFIVLSVALFASVLFVTMFSLMRQSAWMSRTFAQRLTASAWNDRILARIAAVVAANPWEKRFYMTEESVEAGLYYFDVNTFPFQDLAEDCERELVSFEGAIMDVVDERRYRVKLNVACGNPPVTYATFTEARVSPGLLDLANRGVVQTTINLGPDEVGLTASAFNRSIRRSAGISELVSASSVLPVAKTGGSAQFNPEMVNAAVEKPKPADILGIPPDSGEVFCFLEGTDKGQLRKVLKSIESVISIDPSSPYQVRSMVLPTGETIEEFAKGTCTPGPIDNNEEGAVCWGLEMIVTADKKRLYDENSVPICTDPRVFFEHCLITQIHAGTYPPGYSSGNYRDYSWELHGYNVDCYEARKPRLSEVSQSEIDEGNEVVKRFCDSLNKKRDPFYWGRK